MRSPVPTLVLALAVVGAACSSGSPGPDFVRVSGPMPTISGSTLDGHAFGPADYAGKIVVVNFWNQDCPPCRQEQPVLEGDFERLFAHGVMVVGLVYVGGNWPNDRAAALAFLRGNGVTYPNLMDAGSRLATAFGIAGIPTTVIAGRDGTLRFRILGKIRPGQVEELVAEIDPYSVSSG